MKKSFWHSNKASIITVVLIVLLIAIFLAGSANKQSVLGQSKKDLKHQYKEIVDLYIEADKKLEKVKIEISIIERYQGHDSKNKARLIKTHKRLENYLKELEKALENIRKEGFEKDRVSSCYFCWYQNLSDNKELKKYCMKKATKSEAKISRVVPLVGPKITYPITDRSKHQLLLENKECGSLVIEYVGHGIESEPFGRLISGCAKQCPSNANIHVTSLACDMFTSENQLEKTLEDLQKNLKKGQRVVWKGVVGPVHWPSGSEPKLSVPFIQALTNFNLAYLFKKGEMKTIIITPTEIDGFPFQPPGPPAAVRQGNFPFP